MGRFVLVLLLALTVVALGCGGSATAEEEAYVQDVAQIFNDYMQDWAVVVDVTAQSDITPEDFENVKAVLADIVRKSEQPAALSPPDDMDDAHAVFLQMFDSYGRAAERLLLGFETNDPELVSLGEESLLAANEDLSRWVESMEPWKPLMDQWIEIPDWLFPGAVDGDLFCRADRGLMD
jgi:cytochrome c556